MQISFFDSWFICYMQLIINITRMTKMNTSILKQNTIPFISRTSIYPIIRFMIGLLHTPHDRQYMSISILLTQLHAFVWFLMVVCLSATWSIGLRLRTRRFINGFVIHSLWYYILVSGLANMNIACQFFDIIL